MDGDALLTGAIVLVRHGRTAWNAEGRFLSRTDLPLAPGAAAELRGQVPPDAPRPDALWSSPMLRARQSAATLFPGISMRLEPALREVDFGTWEGRTAGEIAASEPEAWSRRRAAPATFAFPGGETFAAAAHRLRPFARALLRARGTRVVVGHRVALGVLERLLRGLALDDPRVAPLEPGEWRIVRAPDG